MNGDDDPDDRRTYPWIENGGNPDESTLRYYHHLIKLHRSLPSLTEGDLRILLADDAAQTVAYSRKTHSQASIVVINRSQETRQVSIPVAGYLPDGVLLATQVSAMPHYLIGWANLQWPSTLEHTTLYGYELRHNSTSGGPYTTLALVTGATTYVDTQVEQGATYFYVVRAVDTSFNRSPDSNEVQATAELRMVTVTFNMTVSPHTESTGESVYIAGTLDRLDPSLPVWDSGGVVLTRIDSTHWSITLTGPETTQIEYKYTLGSWYFVDKGASCEELSNRLLTLSYGVDGHQVVNDTVLNWRNIAPCEG